MFDRVKQTFFPRLEPEIRRFRIQLARSILRSLLVLIGIWVISLVMSILITRIPREGVLYDVVGITALSLAGIVGFWLLRRGQINLTAYLISSVVYLLMSASAVLYQGFVYLVAPAFLVTILISGSVIGKGAPYLFSALSILSVVVSLLLQSDQPASPQATLYDIENLIFLFTFSVVSVSSAGVLNSLTQQIRRTVGDLNRQADQMAQLAYTDPLTGLSNRRAIFDQLRSEFARSRRYRRSFSLLYIDLDGFKAINDQYGHLFGDEVLRGAALAMRAVLRSTDLMARIGGDEFAVLLPETTLEGGKNVATKLRKALTAFGKQVGGHIPPLTFSAGVAQVRPEDEDVEQILRRADHAQYKAKSSGKGVTMTQEEVQIPAE